MSREKKWSKEDIISNLGHEFHTAFRKAIHDSEHGHKIWMLIREMPREEWGAVLEFVYRGMEDIFGVVTKEAEV